MGFTTGRTDLCFLKEETSPGTLIVPAGADVLLMVADAQIDQSRSTFPSMERRDTYSRTSLLQGRYPAGTFTLEFYMSRTGVATTGVTAIKTLLKNMFGREDTSSGTDIVYRLARTIDTDLTFSLFYRKGGIFYQCTGCFINDATWSFVATPDEGSILRCVATGFFYRRYVVGNATITEALATTAVGLDSFKVATTLVGVFPVGSYIEVGSLNTSHKIVTLDSGTGIGTVTPVFGSDQVSGSAITGYLPTAVEAGTPVSSHRGHMTYDSNNYLPLGGGVHLANGRRVLVEQKNDNDFPTADARDEYREVTFDNIRAYCDPTGSVRHDLLFYHADQLTQKAIAITFGTGAGGKWLFTMGQSIIINPKLSGDGVVEINATSRALATSAYDNELTLKSF